MSILGVIAAFALSSTAVPERGQFLAMGAPGEADVIEAQGIERTGSGGQVLMIGVMDHTVESGGRVLVMVKQFDCSSRRLRDLEGSLYSADFELLGTVRKPNAWFSVTPNSPFDRLLDHLCEGAPLAEAGKSYRNVVRDRIARSDARSR